METETAIGRDTAFFGSAKILTFKMIETARLRLHDYRSLAGNLCWPLGLFQKNHSRIDRHRRFTGKGRGYFKPIGV